MNSRLDFTGERFVPGVPGEIAHEHWHRYAFARRFAAGRRVLDVACGEGYGSALLAASAREVTGVDVARDVVRHAAAAYVHIPHLRFVAASAAALPLPDASIDVAVSFETIEHLPPALQPRMIAELARVLAPDGILVLSAPNPVEYSDARSYRNPFHTHEPTREELGDLLAGDFPARRWFSQRRYFGSAIWSEAAGAAAPSGHEAWQSADGSVDPARAPPPMYFVVVAARNEAALPAAWPALSLFSDASETELARLDAQAAEVLRLDALLKSRDDSLDRAARHVEHLEDLVAVRERLVEERDRQLRDLNAALAVQHERAQGELATAREQCVSALAERDAARADAASHAQAEGALSAERERLERALEAQERIITYRQSARWWAGLPWLRLRMLLRKARGR